MSIRLPKLPQGWQWNEIRRVSRLVHWERQYEISASKDSSVDVTHAAATVLVNFHEDLPEDIEQLFQNALDSVANQAAFKPKHQPVLDKIQEIGASYDIQRSLEGF